MPRSLPRFPAIFARVATASWLGLCALGLGACSSEPKGPDPKEQLKMHREFALRYFDQGDLVRAQHQSERGLEIDPKDPTLLLMNGWIRQRRGTPKDILVAEKIFRDLAPKDDYRSHLGLAEALERKGVMFDEASRAVADKSREPDGGKTREARTKELAEESRAAWRESIENYNAVLKKKPGEFQALNGLQRVHALRGEYETSLNWAEQLLVASQAEIGFWNQQLERPDLSAEEEQRLRGLLGSSGKLLYETHLTASTLLVNLGRDEEALAHLDQALEQSGGAPELYARRGQLLIDLGRHEEAIAELRSFVRTSSEDYEHPDIKRAWAMIERCEKELEFRARVRTAGADGSEPKAR